MQRTHSFFLTLLLASSWLGLLACRPKAEETTEPAKGPIKTEPSPSPMLDSTKELGPDGGQLEARREDETPAKPPRKYVVAALGDSITDAKSGGGGYLELLRSRCPESRFVDFGKGGDMTNQMLRRLQRDILPRVEAEGFTTLLVYGGVNDLYSDLTAGRSNERIEESLSRIYQLAKSDGMDVVAITVSPWGGFRRYFNERRSENTRLLNSWILGQEGGELVERVVDSYSLLSCGVPDELCPKYESRFRDGLHLGPEGHRVLGEKLAREAFADCR